MKLRSMMIILITLSLLILSACTRSASTPSVITTDEATEFLPAGDSAQTDQNKAAASPTTKPTRAKPTATEEPEATATAEILAPAPSFEIATAEIQAVLPDTPQATASAPAFDVFSGLGDGLPTFGIRGVVYNETVTIQANDFPANSSYVVSMSRTDTNGVGAEDVATLETGEGGTFLVTLEIPDSLMYTGSIAIRIEFPDGKYAVNWFYNITTY